MAGETFDEDWQAMYERASTEISAWRKAHPYATFNEIEEEIDKRMNRLRAQMLADLAGEAEGTEESELLCPECGERMQRRGKKKRRLQVHGGEVIELERHYVVCPNCGKGFFPPG